MLGSSGCRAKTWLLQVKPGSCRSKAGSNGLQGNQGQNALVHGDGPDSGSWAARQGLSVEEDDRAAAPPSCRVNWLAPRTITNPPLLASSEPVAAMLFIFPAWRDRCCLEGLLMGEGLCLDHAGDGSGSGHGRQSLNNHLSTIAFLREARPRKPSHFMRQVGIRIRQTSLSRLSSAKLGMSLRSSWSRPAAISDELSLGAPPTTSAP